MNYVYLNCKATDGNGILSMLYYIQKMIERGPCIMARRAKRSWDEERTALLDQSELLVEKGKGGPDYFLAWLQEPEMLTCPLCSGKIIKIQDLFSKTYHELIQTSDGSTVVTLEYDFHKFRCLNDACRHIFAKEIRFASRRDNVTYRLESKIAQLVMDGLSYGDISNLFQSSITRQAVGQIFNRWVRKKEELRKTQIPLSSIAIVSGATDKDRYTAILNLDDGIKVYDVLFGVQSADIAAVIRRIGAGHIKTILSDCDPTIIETIKDNLPKASHIIPVHYWFKLVTEDFAEYAHDRIKWCSVPDKDALIMLPETELGFRTSNISRLLNERPVIAMPYRNFNDLRALISRRDEMWVFQELVDWIDNTDADFRNHLSTTIDRLHWCRKAIENHIHYRHLVPEQLYPCTEAIEQHISRMKTFSPEVLQARVLYSNETDLQNWSGIPIEDVVAALNTMNGGYRK